MCAPHGDHLVVLAYGDYFDGEPEFWVWGRSVLHITPHEIAAACWRNRTVSS
jgi:hypothetical protein